MDLHLFTGIAVLLLLVVVSAYRDALRNEAIGRFRTSAGNFPSFNDNDQFDPSSAPSPHSTGKPVSRPNPT
jgi:hypothetical protein